MHNERESLKLYRHWHLHNSSSALKEETPPMAAGVSKSEKENLCLIKL